MRRGQCGQILAHQILQLLLVVVSDDNGLEARSIAETLLVDLQDAVVVNFLQRLLRDRSQTRMMVVENGADGVVVVHLRRGIAVGQEGVGAVQQTLESHRVATRLGEVEVNELKQRLHILHRDATANTLSLCANRRLHAYRLARQHLAQRQGIKLGHTGIVDGAADEREVGNVGIGVERRTALATQAERYGILGIVCLLGIYLQAIRQRVLRKSMTIGLLTDDGAFLGGERREVRGEVSLHLLFSIRCILQLLGSGDDILYLLLGGQHQSFLVRRIHHYHLVLVGDEFLDGLVDLVQVHLTVEAACQLHLVLDGHQRLIIQEVAHTGAHKSRVTTVVTFTELTLVMVQFQSFGTLQLCLRETVLTNLFRHAHSGNDAT